MPRAPSDIVAPLVFARSRVEALAAPVTRPAIAVWPKDSRGWNDFAHNFWIHGVVIKANGDVHQLELKLMFEGGGYTFRILAEMLAETSGWLPATAVEPPFCSLLANTDAYRELVEQCGFDLAIGVLRSLGDAVLLRLELDDPLRLSLLDSVPFHEAMVRQEEAYTALRRGGRHLRPIPAADLDDAATTFHLVAKLRNATNRYVVSFDFDPDPLDRNRLAVLIGRNGVGKTQVLLALLAGLRDAPVPKEIALERRPRFLIRDGERLRTRRPDVSRVIVFASTIGDDYPREVLPWEGLDYRYVSMIGGRDGRFDALTTALIDTLRDDFRNLFPLGESDVDDGVFSISPRAGRMALLEHAVAPMGLWDAIHIPIKADDDRDLPHVERWEGQRYFPLARARHLNEQRRLWLAQLADPERPPVLFADRGHPRRLSSGETAMFRFATQAAAEIETGSLLLFDEPETHLHPHFISDFAEILHLLLTATKSVAIIATHSAYLVRETPSRRVSVLTMQDGEVAISSPRMQTYGATIDSISQAAFQDGGVRHQFQTTLSQWVARQPRELTIEQVVAEFGDALNRESLSLVARLLDRRRTATQGGDAEA